MGRVETWFRSAPPVAKLFMAIGITSAVVVVNRLVYTPYVRRKKYRAAEEWANVIIEQEEAMEQSGQESTNNISY